MRDAGVTMKTITSKLSSIASQRSGIQPKPLALLTLCFIDIFVGIIAGMSREWMLIMCVISIVTYPALNIYCYGYSEYPELAEYYSTIGFVDTLREVYG